MKKSSYFYRLKDHIYVTQFQGELILLDTKRDQYMICPPEVASNFLALLNGAMDPLNPALSIFRKSEEDDELIQQLLGDQILEKSDSPFPFYIDQKPHSNGVSDIDWCLPLEGNKIGIDFEVGKALMTLVKVNLYIKFKGFYSAIGLIKRSRKNDLEYCTPHMDKLMDLAAIVNKACLLYPKRTKCLEWAMTFVLLAIKRGWRCNLEIGVQNYPFMAHAWVESGGKVVMDSQDLREGMGIILNEPFRRVRK